MLRQLDYFEATISGQTYYWPLPPSESKEALARFGQIRQELEGLSHKNVSKEDLQQIQYLQKVFNEMQHPSAAFDPAMMVPHTAVETACAKGSPAEKQQVFLQLAAYYREVEQRWVRPNAAPAAAAAHQAGALLDLLVKEDAPAPAILALKDFIGMCRSSVLN